MEFKKLHSAVVDEQMLFGTHESGLRVYVFPKRGFSEYYAVYATEYGSIDNKFIAPGDTEPTTVPDGIAHFLEHKLFEEEGGGNAFDKFALTGASANAFTSFNVTAYLFSCTEDFYTNLDLLLDFVSKPYFTDENVAKEQGIIAQEIKMYEDDPMWRVYFNLLSALYHNHPVKYDIAGTVESISQITPEILYKCYNTFYNPSNMLLFLVGDIDENEAVKIIDKHVKIAQTTGEIKRIYPNEPSYVAHTLKEQSLSVSVPMFDMGFKDSDIGYDGRRLLEKELINSICLEALIGKSSTLYTSLYESGLIDDSFGGDSSMERDYGFTNLSGESENPKAVLEMITKHIEGIKKAGFNPADIERVKKLTLGRYMRQFNNIQKIGNGFMRNLFNNINVFDTPDIISNITTADVNKRFNEHFRTDNIALSVINPM